MDDDAAVVARGRKGRDLAAVGLHLRGGAKVGREVAGQRLGAVGVYRDRLAQGALLARDVKRRGHSSEGANGEDAGRVAAMLKALAVKAVEALTRIVS